MEYRRTRVPGASVFLTIVTNGRRKLLANACLIDELREALTQTIDEMPFVVDAAVILPDHIHFIWTLPQNDDGLSKRVGRFKALVTKRVPPNLRQDHSLSAARQNHREAGIWQRRFWEHTIRDPLDFENHLNYIHYNPVKHGYSSCPHAWETSSFSRWVKRGVYDAGWACVCDGRERPPISKEFLEMEAGE